MKMKFLLAVVGLAAASAAQSPALKFTKGEVLRYKATLESTQSDAFRGETQAIKMMGSHTITMKVTNASSTSATMSVTYSGAQAAATVLSLPPKLRDKKSEIEKNTTAALKKSMNEGTRTQVVSSRGQTVYTVPVGDGTSVTIPEGAFLMVSLPSSPPIINKPWTANVRMPSAANRSPQKFTFKYVGLAAYKNQKAYKIVLSASNSDQQKEGEVSGKRTMTITGYVLISTSGKVVYGELSRKQTTTMTHAKEGTRTSQQTTKQTYTIV
jgi:hypothetical protein